MPVISSSRLSALRRAMLPLDGSISEHVPDIVEAYARIVDPREWKSRDFIDLTSGSCLMPMIFAAHGAGRVVVNDTAARTQLAAAALFGGHRLRWARIQELLSADRRRGVTPTFHFACDYLTEDVAAVFDRLYHGALSRAEQPVYRYLALRWVQGFAPDEEFTPLLTHDPVQLRADLEHDWAPYLRRARRVEAVLKRLAQEINTAIGLMRTTRVELHGEDMLTLVGRLAYGRAPFIVANPPTRGLDEYVIDDQLIHSLLANRWLPLSRCREDGADFWRRRVGAALRAAPRGAHVLSWGGDGVLRWPECLRFWTRYATPVTVRRLGRGRNAPGWVILEKR